MTVEQVIGTIFWVLTGLGVLGGAVALISLVRAGGGYTNR